MQDQGRVRFQILKLIGQGLQIRASRVDNLVDIQVKK